MWRRDHWCRGTEATEEAMPGCDDVTGLDPVEVVKRGEIVDFIIF